MTNKFLQDRATETIEVSIGEIVLNKSVTVQEFSDAEDKCTITGKHRHQATAFLAAAQKITHNGEEVEKKDYMEFFGALTMQDITSITGLLVEAMGLEKSDSKKK